MSIYDSLNPEQLAAVKHDRGPLLILAGAGSGKTRVLTHRIAYLISERNVSPYQILAITFTNKAAKEMKERVEKTVGEESANIWVSTFHSTCVRILRRFIESIGYDRNFTIYDADDQKSLMKDVLKQLQIDTKQMKEKAFLSAISSAKDELVSPEAYAMTAYDFTTKRIAEVYKEYQRRLKENNALDFDDLITKTVELFRTNPDVLAYYQRRFRYIMVDEYQDTNTAQFQLIKLMASSENEYGETEHNLCVVGDDDQSIYKFRGANIYNILNFEKEYPDARVIKLEQNYRSTKNILAAANEVIHNNRGRKDKSLWTNNAEGSVVHFTRYESDIDEGNFVAEKIAELIREKNCLFRDFAVLYRTNAQSLVFEKALRAKQIKAKTIGALSFFQRKEIKDIIAYLKTIDNAKDDIALTRIINVPKRGIGLTTIDRLKEYAARNELGLYASLERVDSIPSIERVKAKLTSFLALIESLRYERNQNNVSLKQLIKKLLEETGYIEELRSDEPESAEERIQNIDALISYAERYEQTEDMPSLTGFLEYCGLNSEEAASEENEEDTDSENYVSLMTLHNAKGLEFPYVFLCGMEEGLFPSFMSLNAENPEPEIEEERRLCYVGITRAMNELYMSAASRRMLRGENQYNAVSRFIKEIPRYLLNITSPTGGDSSFRQSSAFPESPVRQSKSTWQDSKKAFSAPAYQTGSSRNPVTYVTPGSQGRQSSNAYTMFDKPVPAAADKPLSYDVGDTVLHIKFGTGQVKSIVKGKNGHEVTVEFPHYGTKKLLSTFANLKKL
ncbi:MAG: UvrD-helicase domain-containing protein [Lachnospiraceae bacterium]|nr:UvrD-helicase domain-containing protein [Lachnospiraceae bacterium]